MPVDVENVGDGVNEDDGVNDPDDVLLGSFGLAISSEQGSPQSTPPLRSMRNRFTSAFTSTGWGQGTTMSLPQQSSACPGWTVTAPPPQGSHVTRSPHTTPSPKKLRLWRRFFSTT